jgi:hypothetical protein
MLSQSFFTYFGILHISEIHRKFLELIYDWQLMKL